MNRKGLRTGKTVAGSPLEEGFARLWRSLKPDLPEPEREHRFNKTRKWRFDFSWPEARLAVEIEGMAYGGGRHQRREGFTRDAEKYRAAVNAGWRLLRYTSDEWKERPVQIIEEVGRVLVKLSGENHDR